MLSKKTVLLVWLTAGCQVLHSQIKPSTNIGDSWEYTIEYQCPSGWHEERGSLYLTSDWGFGMKSNLDLQGGELKIHHLYDDNYSFEISNNRCSRKGEMRYSNFFKDEESLSGTFETPGDNTAMWGTGLCCRGSITLRRKITEDKSKKKEKEQKKEKEADKQEAVTVNNLHELSTGNKYTLKNVIFPLSSSQLEPSSFTELNKVYDMLEKNKKMVIRLEGHTDVIGNHKANKKLSKERVKAIKKFLTQKGIASKRIKLKWYGDTRPLMIKGSVKEREVNRRVELVVISS